MAIPVSKPATYQDVLDAPAERVAELIQGVLHAQRRPAGPHSEAASVLGMDIGGAYHRGRGGPGGWIILDGPELHFGEDILVPDLVGWKRERLPAVPNAPFIELAPDWVCEVLSPSTAQLDRRFKLPSYAAQGVPWVWIVDPIARYVDVLQLDGTNYRLPHTYGGDEKARIPPFNAIELELSALWPGPAAG